MNYNSKNKIKNQETKIDILEKCTDKRLKNPKFSDYIKSLTTKKNVERIKDCGTFLELLGDLEMENKKSLAAIEKLQRELERIESKSSGLGDENKNLKGEIKSLKIDNKNLKNKFNAVVKQAKCLRSAIDEHWDSKNILENAREKFNSPELKREVKSKNKNKSLDLEI